MNKFLRILEQVRDFSQIVMSVGIAYLGALSFKGMQIAMKLDSPDAILFFLFTGAILLSVSVYLLLITLDKYLG